MIYHEKSVEILQSYPQKSVVFGLIYPQKSVEVVLIYHRKVLEIEGRCCVLLGEAKYLRLIRSNHGYFLGFF